MDEPLSEDGYLVVCFVEGECEVNGFFEQESQAVSAAKELCDERQAAPSLIADQPVYVIRATRIVAN